jgi:hypothetical protein
MHIPNVQEINNDIQSFIHAAEEKEQAALDLFEDAWWLHTHEHRLLHTWEIIFTKVMILIGA